MHFLMLVCVVSAASAQYNYRAGINNDETPAGSNKDESIASAQPVAEEYNKIFYSYSAPEQEFEDLNAEEHISKALRKNLRVIFIRGPENTALENAALQLAKGAADEHTAIYVLSKQSDIGELANQLQKLKANNTVKPEVHFVKYRTQADAENAQRTIQAQYDDLPGTTNNNAPVAASVVSFPSKSISSSAINNLAVDNDASTTPASPKSTISSRNSYLPPGRRYKRTPPRKFVGN